MELSAREETSTLERIWGPLFDEDGQPTVRLSQFLRGLAVYIIQHCTPRYSIVITPIKMIRYYELVKLTNESYPWSTIFDKHSSISRMYRNLECQHHLIQEQNDQRPDIPGLTPIGFERWVMLFIRAHPEDEYRRLQKSLREMPISNPDNGIERFPKEIPRRLFPRFGDRRVRHRIGYSISTHAAIELPQDFMREEPHSYGDSLFRTSSIDGRSCNPQQPRHRRVSFVLPNIRRGTCQDLDEPLRSGGERTKRQADQGAKSYGDGRYDRT